ncbi:hypothetical protein HC931_18855 [Candidatus Gracilibacteria bacterium]|nr:hypothetical protein [Candidatus Gracilibacteria bacterium]
MVSSKKITYVNLFSAKRSLLVSYLQLKHGNYKNNWTRDLTMQYLFYAIADKQKADYLYENSEY